MEKKFYCVRSEDWELSLKRYKPRNAVATVILCHGLAANKNSVDFGNEGTKKWEKYSLAAFLYKQNKKKFDTWVVELRGRNSWKKCSVYDPRKHPLKYRWCIDDYINKDMPAIISFIKKKMQGKLFWIGKSMGGIIAYAYGEKNKDLDGIVTIASPVAFEKEQLWKRILAAISPRRFATPINIVKVLKELGLINMLKKNITQKSNIDEKILNEYIEKGLNNTISSRVLEQFGLFYRHHDFMEYPRYPWLYDIASRFPFLKPSIYSYKENLHLFDAPLLAIAGGGDATAPPEDVKYALSHVGSRDITYHEFSKENGYSADYGHLDLNLGKKAREEVYTVIYEWLMERI